MNARLCAAFAKELRAHWRKHGVRFGSLGELEQWVTANCNTTHRASQSPAVQRFLTKELSTRKVLALLKPEVRRQLSDARKLAKKHGRKRAPSSAAKRARIERINERALATMAPRVPTAADALSALRKVAGSNDRALIADVRAHMPGTKGEQDAALLELQRSGKAVLFNNDGPRGRISKHEWDGGVWLPGTDRPRTIIYRDTRAGG